MTARRYVEPGSKEAIAIERAELALTAALELLHKEFDAPCVLAALMRQVQTGLRSGILEGKVTVEEAREWLHAWADCALVVPARQPDTVN